MSDAFFVLVALVAAGCFSALITLQVMEWKYYQKPPAVWTVVNGKFVQ
jgi:hypothetical protein